MSGKKKMQMFEKERLGSFLGLRGMAKAMASAMCLTSAMLLQACHSGRSPREACVPGCNADTGLVNINAATDTMIRISDLADTIMYFKLDRCAQKKAVTQAMYDGKRILVYDRDSLFFYNTDGKEEKRFSCPFACLDYDMENGKVYVFEFRKRLISILSDEGELLSSINIRSNLSGYYGHYFAALSDSVFAMAIPNAGGNDDALVLVSSKGRILDKRGHHDTFRPSGNTFIHNMTWDFPLLRTPDETLYCESYCDTAFVLRGNGDAEPLFVQSVLKKIPLECRPEVKGQNLNDYILKCKSNMWATPRYYVNGRFILAQYVYGRSDTDFPGYLLYDRKDCSSRVHKDTLSMSRLHMGIFNDYDGGLAFTPISQSGNYLLMSGAGIAQGGMSSRPKTLYEKGRKFGDALLPAASGISMDEGKEAQLTSFLADFDEERQTMITVLKMKE